MQSTNQNKQNQKQLTLSELCSGKNPYEKALEIIGARVLAFADFKTIDGDWIALVEYQDKSGYILGRYGSSPSEWSFLSDLGTSHFENPALTRERWGEVIYTRHRWLRFQLDNLLTYEVVMKRAIEIARYDLDAQRMVKFLYQNQVPSRHTSAYLH